MKSLSEAENNRRRFARHDWNRCRSRPLLFSDFELGNQSPLETQFQGRGPRRFRFWSTTSGISKDLLTASAGVAKIAGKINTALAVIGDFQQNVDDYSLHSLSFVLRTGRSGIPPM